MTHGIPVALYSDKHSLFRINAKEADPEAETQFGRVAHKPALNHPWKKYPDGKSAPEGCNATLNRSSAGEKRHFYLALIDRKDTLYTVLAESRAQARK